MVLFSHVRKVYFYFFIAIHFDVENTCNAIYSANCVKRVYASAICVKGV